MGVRELRDDYTDASHNAMIQSTREELGRLGYVVTDVVRVKKGIAFIRDNYTKIYYEPKKEACCCDCHK